VSTDDHRVSDASRSADDHRVSDASRSADESPIPLLDLKAENAPLLPEIREAFERVFAKNAFVLGQEVEFFEKEVAAYLGVKHAIGVSSGTDALLVAMMALGVGPEDEVVTSTFSFFATAGCISRLGARPVFVDVDPVTLNIDATAVGAALSDRTRAIMPVHLYGQPADMSALKAISEAFAVPIVEDAAQAIGAHHALGPVGGLGALAGFSFYPTKNLGGFGDGGLVTTDDDTLAERVRILRVHGGERRYYHAVIGGNFRLDGLQGAALRVKLPHLTAWTEGRKKNAQLYDLLFLEEDLPEGALITPKRIEPGHVYNQYVIRVRDPIHGPASPGTPALRDRLRAHLTDRRIGSEVYYPLPLHLQDCFASLGYGLGSFPEAERAAGEVLALPVHQATTQGQIERVVTEIGRFLRGEAP
jgi:dTDP-4-amino-4,6-dideoxygalactose transaminase